MTTEHLHLWKQQIAPCVFSLCRLHSSSFVLFVICVINVYYIRPGNDTEHLAPFFVSEHKLEQSEEEALLSWEALMKDRYLLSTQQEQSQSTERRILDTVQK